MKKIDTKDISVVIQGAIDNENTRLCIASVRKYLKGSEIILSTWEGSNTDGYNADIVVLNKDPGGIKDLRTKFTNNLNRQLVSTSNGVKKASRKFCLKLRSDLILQSNAFLQYFFKFEDRNENYSVFKNRVIFLSLFFKKYMGEIDNIIMPTPYHISDWLAFGYTDDVRMLFDIPLAIEPENSNYLIKNNYCKGLKFNLFGASHQYAPEQYIFYNFIKKNTKIEFEFRNIMDYNGENIEESKKYIVNNCIPIDARMFKIYCGKNGRPH